MSQSATETITYINADTNATIGTKTQTINFTRSATIDLKDGTVSYSTWSTGTFDAVINPTSSDGTEYAGLTTAKAQVDAYTESTPDDYNVSVYYYSDTVTVSPKAPKDDTTTVTPKDAGTPMIPGQEFPVYPAGVTTTDLTRTSTRTIHYLDGVSGATLAQDNTQTINWYRTATIDRISGSVIGYSDWMADGSDTFAALGNPTIPGMTPANTVDALTETDPAPVTQDIYYYLTELTITPVTPEDGVTSTTTPHNQGDPIDPNDNPDKPKGPTYPAGVTIPDLTRTSARTIHYVDGSSGVTLAKDKIQTIDWYRTATINAATGELTGYSIWMPVGSGTFDALENPTIPNMTPANTVDALTETDPAPVTQHVYYYSIKNPDDGDSTNPVNPGDAGSTSNPANPGDTGSASNPANPGNTGSTSNPANPGDVGSTSNPANPGDSSLASNSATKVANSQLPQTGEEQAPAETALGLALASLVSLFGLTKKRRKND